MAPLALPGVRQGSWPTPPFHPTPKEKPKTLPKKIDDKGKDKNGEGSGVPWVPVLICLALLSAAAAAFQLRRSRRMAQFADGP